MNCCEDGFREILCLFIAACAGDRFLKLSGMVESLSPKTICEEVDKIQRGFVWGDSDQGRKTRLISWEVCCLPKNDGGLGIWQAQHMNEAFLMKMLWNLIKNPNDLWCKVLYNKYGRNNDLTAGISVQSYDSPLWKALAGDGAFLQVH
ncbi:ribonuclease H, partial [Trifolium medium]|nr:ribonuclease H [Trifolium medium]